MSRPFRSAALTGALLTLAGCSAGSQVAERPMPEAPPAPAEMPAEAPPPADPYAAFFETPPYDYDGVEAGRFDFGRMFTLDDPPTAYFREAYGINADQAWFDKARLGALRFASYCSASFISPEGLIMTNHHCARQSITQVSSPAEDFNADGFLAQTLADERAVDGLYVEQLIAIDDVSAEVDAAAEAAGTNASARSAAREEVAAAIEERMMEAAGGEGSGMRVQVISFYSGGLHKAYTFKRYDDIRLVWAPEDRLGKFGGDPDNFTFPRYSLDITFFRAYDADGTPVESPVYFAWGDGAEEGEPVFVVGNPGSTTRLQTVAQLAYRRDNTEPVILDYLQTREDVLAQFLADYPDAPEAPELTDTYLSLANGRKAYTGRVAGLRDPENLARKLAAERQFLAALDADPALRAEYGDVVEAIADNRQRAAEMAPLFGSFIGLGGGNGSAVLGRALYATFYAGQLASGASEEDASGLREAILDIDDQPAALGEMLLAQRLRDIERYMGADSPLTRSVLDGMTPEARAAAVYAGTVFADSASTAQALGADLLMSQDPAIRLAQAIAPAFGQLQQMQGAYGDELEELTSRLARARFAAFGQSVPPDATFSLRISDGVVQGYPYNGTDAPTHTTLFGLYDHYYSYCREGMTEGCDWDLPQEWLDKMGDLDLATPMNFVSTNDIIGGNSGSPVLDANLDVVGIAFDGNVEGLPGDYIFDDRLNRTVSVDIRAVREALEEIYEADRLVRELSR